MPSARSMTRRRQWMSMRLGVALLVASLALSAEGPRALESPTAAEARQLSYDLTNEGQALLEKGRYTEAAEKLKRATAIALNSFPAHYALGQALVGARRYREAIEPLEIALELQPNHLGARLSLAEAYL